MADELQKQCLQLIKRCQRLRARCDDLASRLELDARARRGEYLHIGPLIGLGKDAHAQTSGLH